MQLKDCQSLTTFLEDSTTRLKLVRTSTHLSFREWEPATGTVVMSTSLQMTVTTSNRLDSATESISLSPKSRQASSYWRNYSRKRNPRLKQTRAPPASWKRANLVAWTMIQPHQWAGETLESQATVRTTWCKRCKATTIWFQQCRTTWEMCLTSHPTLASSRTNLASPKFKRPWSSRATTQR